MPTDNSKYGISKLDIEKAALGDFDDYVPSEPEPPVQPVIPVQPVYNNVQPMQDVYSNGPIPADVYSNAPVNNNSMGDTAVFCTVCGAQLPAGAIFCTGCGAQLGNPAAPSYDSNAQMYDQQYNDAQYGAAPAAASVFCTGCGNPIPDGYQFCTVCGAPVGAGYNDAQQYQQFDDVQYGQSYDNDAQTLAADDVFNAQQYAQYAADDAYAYDNQDPYAAADAFVFCTNCGAQISSSLSFCTSCGAPVGGAAAQDFADPYAAAPQAPAKKGGLFSKRKNK
jgi:predicted amidophosphoribosyltransferase